METITKDNVTELQTLRGYAVTAKKKLLHQYDNEIMGDTLCDLHNHAIDYLNDYCDDLDDVIEDSYWEYGFDDVDDMTDLAKEAVSSLDTDDWRFDAQIAILAGCKAAKDHGAYYVQFTNGNSSGDGETEPLEHGDVIDWIGELIAGIDKMLKGDNK